ncbi:MAG: CocE/NonD family hydrolase [Ktedonobacteraceae bacterium]
MTSRHPRELQIQFDQRVPMRDDITLSADIYLPLGSPHVRRPVILERTPYMKAGISFEMVKYFVRHGYVFVAIDVRGRGDSDGEFLPYFNEGKDGYDAIEWCARQPWSDGNVGTLGASYGGRVQWLAAIERPPHLRAMVVLVPPSDPFVETPTGTPGPMHICWLHLVSGRALQSMDVVDWGDVYKHLPIISMDDDIGRRIPAWRKEVEHAQLDSYWLPLCYQQHFEQVNVPVLHISGWYDDEQIGTPINYIGMTTRALTPGVREQQRLLMGPWGHATNASQRLGAIDFGPQAVIDLRAEELNWYDRWLKRLPVEHVPPVRIFVMGENNWRDEEEWPLARTAWTLYYLHSAGHANSRFGDGSLSTSKPEAGQPVDSYRYNPAEPVLFITDPTSSQIGGPDDYAALQERSDILVYTTEPLTTDIEVTGPIIVDLYASSSAPDTDFMAMLIDVWPNNFRQRLCDGMVRARFRNGMDRPALIQPGHVYHYRIDCWNTSQLFRAGHRICLQITSSAFPKYDRNQNIGGPLGVSTELAIAEQHIYHDAEHPSAVVLPIIARKR